MKTGVKKFPNHEKVIIKVKVLKQSNGENREARRLRAWREAHVDSRKAKLTAEAVAHGAKMGRIQKVKNQLARVFARKTARQTQAK